MADADVSAWVWAASAAKVIAFRLSDEAASVTGVGIKWPAGAKAPYRH